MVDQDLMDFYYNKGRTDYINGVYDQPFPFPTKIELDSFEVDCNNAYTKGYQNERTCFESFLL